MLLLSGKKDALPAAPCEWPVPSNSATLIIEDFETGGTGVFSAAGGTTLQVVANNGVVPAIGGDLSGSASGGTTGAGVSDLVVLFTFFVEPGSYDVSIDIQATSDVQPTTAAGASFDPNGVVAGHSFQPAEFTQVAADEWASPVFTLTAEDVNASGGIISGTLNLDGAFRWLFDNLRAEATAKTPEALILQIESNLNNYASTGAVHHGQAAAVFSMTGAITGSLSADDVDAALNQAEALLSHIRAQTDKNILEPAAHNLAQLAAALIEAIRARRDPCKCVSVTPVWRDPVGTWSFFERRTSLSPFKIKTIHLTFAADVNIVVSNPNDAEILLYNWTVHVQMLEPSMIAFGTIRYAPPLGSGLDAIEVPLDEVFGAQAIGQLPIQEGSIFLGFLKQDFNSVWCEDQQDDVEWLLFSLPRSRDAIAEFVRAFLRSHPNLVPEAVDETTWRLSVIVDDILFTQFPPKVKYTILTNCREDPSATNSDEGSGQMEEDAFIVFR